MYSPLTQALIHALQGLPGIGPKSAQRMAFHLLATKGQEKGARLADALKEGLGAIDYCQQCRHFTEKPLCSICVSPQRDERLLCVVQSPADIVAIESSQAYRGRYFVLHGHLSPLDGVGPVELGLDDWFEKLDSTVVSEVIIATNPTAEGRATAHYIASQLQKRSIKCSRIAHGVPIGGELEYLDGGTLNHAFVSRREID
jgi:recombination protein RecR